MRFSKDAAKAIVIVVAAMLVYGSAQAQFLKANGKKIVDAQGNEVIWRGIGLGGWMLQEGYMLRSWGPQHEIEARIVSLVGQENKEEFYEAWLANHTRKIDVDSLASWGYNMIRLPMHYKLFTPPIEDEPVAGEITWRDKGFEMTDELLEWCKANNMYLILDLHAAPGGQGENADISDYDDSKPSLWESEANRKKMIALWKKLAERYKDEPMIAAYDIINEPNWGFQNHDNDPNGCAESQNTMLWNLQKDITTAIREVDPNHVIVIEGNCWGNNYSGLPTLWDNNMVISYHKYWNGNAQSNIQGMIDMRNSRNVPIWLGETGENSNSWFTDCIELLETNGIGWAWWPLKKLGGNNPLQVPMNANYQKVIDYWNGGTKPSAEIAMAGLMQLAEDLKLENNSYKKDVVDAKIRQPHTDETKPFRLLQIKPGVQNTIPMSDYDLGRQGFAYSDADYTNTTGNAGGAQWNRGGQYRNDGVDIELSSDQSEDSNGFNVGWTIDKEWMQYTVKVDSTGGYTLSIRYAGQSQSVVHLEVDGVDVSGRIQLPGTGGYQIWATKEVEDVILEKGEHKLKIYIEKGGANLGYFGFFLSKGIESIPFEAVSGQTDEDGTTITLSFNKELDPGFSAVLEDFQISIDGETTIPLSIAEVVGQSKQLLLTFESSLTDESEIEVAYSGDWLFAEDGTSLAAFEGLSIYNSLPFHFKIPTKIEAEAFVTNVGLVAEETTDSGGGMNIGYTDAGDYLDFYIAVEFGGNYKLEARTAGQSGTGKIRVEQRSLGGVVLNFSERTLPATGGWQTWQTVETSMKLDEGRSILRVRVQQGGFNLNWIRLSGSPNGIQKKSEWMIYPNPTQGLLNIDLKPAMYSSENSLWLYDSSGKEIWKRTNASYESVRQLSLGDIPSGNYLLKLSFQDADQTIRVIVSE